MAAFALQNCQLPFLDTAYITAAAINATPAPDLTTTTMAAPSSSSTPPRFFHPYYSPPPPPREPITTTTTVDSGSSLSEKSRTKPAAVEEKEKKKRKTLNGKPTSSHVSKRRRSSRRKCRAGDNDDAKENEEEEQPPTDYIHVRARRGQATDSHSLAERVRREKISERMKQLQGLVPGCDKVIGKAIMLDEIINYVQSLQNQVEFLSMRLASLTPSDLYESSLDMNEYLAFEPRHQVEPTSFADMPTDSFPLVDSSLPFLMHGQEQGQLSYGYGQRFLHHQQQFQFQLNDLCSFQ